MMQLASLPASAMHPRCAATCSASRTLPAVHGLSSSAPIFQLTAARPLRNTARTSGAQKLPLGCRVRSQASALAQSTGRDVDQDLPEGYVWYETMIVLRPDMNEEERCGFTCRTDPCIVHGDVELAKFEAFLKKEDAREISALVRGSQHLAYPIKGYWDGIYVLYTYAAQRKTSQRVQKLLSTPVVGSETNVLRHMTFIN